MLTEAFLRVETQREEDERWSRRYRMGTVIYETLR